MRVFLAMGWAAASAALAPARGGGGHDGGAPYTATAPAKDQRCVVVGGGPVGLAAALTLARPPHSYAVTVLEQTIGETAVTKYDVTRSYLYNINPRGLDWFMDEAAAAPEAALEKLAAAGSAPLGAMGAIVIVPADPTKPIPPPRQVSISGRIQLSNRTSYWIPRHQTVELLLECCHEHNEQTRGGDDAAMGAFGLITVCAGKRVNAVAPEQDDTLSVHCQDGSVYTGSLVVAADGIDSAVRRCLANTAATSSSSPSSSSWLQSKAESFRLKQYTSPSTGLKLKALQFPPDFTVPNGTDDASRGYHPPSTTVVAIRGVHTGPRRRASLGLLPMKDPRAVRPANVNAPRDHEIWALRTGAAAQAWFRHAFPRLRWRDLVDDAEWDRFANANGTTFPPCQHSPGSAVSAPDGLTGVVMVGDACHAFPPDIGQGINAGFQDVVALHRALAGVDVATGTALPPPCKPRHLGDALAAYQANRGPEHAALIRLARFGAPYQYKQPWRRHRLGNWLWTANVVFRTVLNKASFGLIPPVAIVIMVTDHSLSFRQVMRRADGTARTLTLLGLAWAFRFLAKAFHLV